MAMQYYTVHELGEMLRREMLSVSAMKLYASYVRCASYPDPAQHRQQRSFLEKTWPAYSKDQSLARLPEFFWTEQLASGEVWKNMYEQRLQHALSCMNHHIHPLVDPNADPMTGERRSLTSCRPKKSKSRNPEARTACKGGFPLDHEMTERPLFVCECIAQDRGLPTRGPRSMLGDILPARNDAWLNAGPRAFVAFMSDNADI